MSKYGWKPNISSAIWVSMIHYGKALPLDLFTTVNKEHIQTKNWKTKYTKEQQMTQLQASYNRRHNSV
jgi:hypothetical protein